MFHFKTSIGPIGPVVARVPADQGVCGSNHTLA